MTSEEQRVLHPRRAGIGDALARAFPLHEHDKEEQVERHELRRIAIREAVAK